MVTTTARQLIENSLKLLAVLDPSEAASAADADDSFWALNSLIDSWGTYRQTMYAVQETITTCAAGETSYSIGSTTPASDFDQPRPIWIESAAYIDPASTPTPVYVTIPVISDQMNQAQSVPGQTNSLPTTLYYQPTTGEVGTIILWPILTQDVDIVLYVPTAITQFPALATSVKLPTGYERAIRYGLAIELAPMFQAAVNPLVERTARTALADLKRANFRMQDLSVDAGLLSDPTGGWNIQTGP